MKKSTEETGSKNEPMMKWKDIVERISLVRLVIKKLIKSDKRLVKSLEKLNNNWGVTNSISMPFKSFESFISLEIKSKYNLIKQYNDYYTQIGKFEKECEAYSLSSSMKNIHKINDYVDKLVSISCQSKKAKEEVIKLKSRSNVDERNLRTKTEDAKKLFSMRESLINREGDAPLEMIDKERAEFESIPCQLYEIVISFLNNAVINRNLVNNEEVEVITNLTKCFETKPYRQIFSLMRKVIVATKSAEFKKEDLEDKLNEKKIANGMTVADLYQAMDEVILSQEKQNPNKRKSLKSSQIINKSSDSSCDNDSEADNSGGSTCTSNFQSPAINVRKRIENPRTLHRNSLRKDVASSESARPRTIQRPPPPSRSTLRSQSRRDSDIQQQQNVTNQEEDLVPGLEEFITISQNDDFVPQGFPKNSSSLSYQTIKIGREPDEVNNHHALADMEFTPPNRRKSKSHNTTVSSNPFIDNELYQENDLDNAFDFSDMKNFLK